MRHVESQVYHEEAPSEQGSSMAGHAETGRRATAPPHAGAPNPDASPMYSFNLSFEELSNVGLDEAPRHSNMLWMVSTQLCSGLGTMGLETNSSVEMIVRNLSRSIYQTLLPL